MIRNTKAVVSIAVVWILLGLLTGACEEKIDNISIIRTGAVTDISAEGATFRGNISQLGLEEVIDYGFVWSEEVYPTVDGYAKFFGEPPTIGEFEYLNSAGLRKDTTYYLRAFMQTSGSVIYGDMVTFKSLGGRAPVITGFEPNEGTYGSELTIKGDFFSDALAENFVKIGALNCEIIKASRTELTVRVGNGTMISGSYPLFVQVGNHRTQSVDSFMMEGFQIDSISPIKGLANDDVQLWCKNAPQYYMQLSLIANGSSNDISGYHFAYSPTEIRFKIPYDFSFVGPAQISVEFFDSEYNSAGLLLKDYEIAGPQVLSFTPKEAFPGEKIFVTGQYLDKIAGVLIGNTPSTLTSTSPTSGVVAIDYSTPPGKFTIDAPWVSQTKIPSSDSIEIISPWTSDRTFPGGEIANGVGFAINNKMYAGIGSIMQQDFKANNDFWEFDENGSNSKKATFPGVARTSASSAAIGDKGFVIGGKTEKKASLGDFWSYSPATDSWLQLSNVPFGTRYDAIAVVVDEDIYFGTGLSGSSAYSYSSHADIWRYSTITQKWDSITSYPGRARQSLVSFVIGKDIFVGGGFLGSINPKDFWVYHTKTDTWQNLGALPLLYAAASVSALVIDNVAYVTGGTGLPEQIWKFDPTDYLWTQLPSMTLVDRTNRVYNAIGITVNKKGYIIGGYKSYGPTYLSNEIWEFDPSVF
ncbi:MAG: kelch repeat-containing protein [Imperialibacter sp.]|uniref:Kelch repeat-containing protein n=1 Tax=Imperialibacter sp. TaxID=2038411 RepID=UPI003A8519F9